VILLLPRGESGHHDDVNPGHTHGGMEMAP
jgi:hypothetical protein